MCVYVPKDNQESATQWSQKWTCSERDVVWRGMGERSMELSYWLQVIPCVNKSLMYSSLKWGNFWHEMPGANIILGHDPCYRIYLWGWKDGSVLKCKGCSSRRPGSGVPESVWQLKTISSFSSGGADAVFSSLEAPDTHVVHTHACKQSSHTRKIKTNKSTRRM